MAAATAAAHRYRRSARGHRRRRVAAALDHGGNRTAGGRLARAALRLVAPVIGGADAAPLAPEVPIVARITSAIATATDASAETAAPAASDATASGTPDKPEAAGSPDAAWSTADDLKLTAEKLSDIVHHIVTDLVPAGPLRQLLRADLDSVDRRLASLELTRAMAGRQLDEARPMFEQIVADLQRIRTLARIDHERAGNGAGRDADAVPTTREEAIAFLGINGEASERVVKKLVDALRQTCSHPDLARDEGDRRLRESRMKQINGAWDLLKSSAAA